MSPNAIAASLPNWKGSTPIVGHSCKNLWHGKRVNPMMKKLHFLSRPMGAGLFVLATLLAIYPAFASKPAENAQLCDLAAVRAAQVTGVPRNVLLAIARVETGRTVAGRYGPWPWTVNQSGQGAWFQSAPEAFNHVALAVQNGETNIDIGCFQISYRWHGAEFATLAAMFDPEENALYAARYLQRLFDKEGSWDGAIGAYHSRRDIAAAEYLKKVSAVAVGRLPDQIGAEPSRQTVAQTPENRYPLLLARPGAGRMPGSLVSTRHATSTTSLLR